MFTTITNHKVTIQLAYCQHAHVEVITSGSMHFDGMEVVDTVIEHLFCSDCGSSIDHQEADIQIPF